MTYYVLKISEESNMFFFGRNKKRDKSTSDMNDEVKKAKEELYKVIDDATNKTQKVNTQIERLQKDDITLNIFLATGGDRRN